MDFKPDSANQVKPMALASFGPEQDYWEPEGAGGVCWVCKEHTSTAYLDLAYQHRSCARYPGPRGDVIFIDGTQVAPRDPLGRVIYHVP